MQGFYFKEFYDELDWREQELRLQYLFKKRSYKGYSYRFEEDIFKEK